MASQSQHPTVIIDNGTGNLRVGFSGDEEPEDIFPTMIGRPRNNPNRRSSLDGFDGEFIGDTAVARRRDLELIFPMEHGVVKDFETMEKIWAYAYEEKLQVDPTEQALLVTETPLNPKKNREKMAEIFFETFGVPALLVKENPVLSLYAQGRDTGVVVDVGEGSTTISPVYEGNILEHAVKRMDIGGRDATRLLARNLQRGHASMFYHAGSKGVSSNAMEVVRELKEQMSFIKKARPPPKMADESESDDSDDDGEDALSDVEYEYELENGEVIDLEGDTLAECGEVVFDPAVMGKEDNGGLALLTYQSIQKCDIDLRKPLLGNVLLSGAVTQTQGFEDRLLDEIQDLVDGSRCTVCNRGAMGMCRSGSYRALGEDFNLMFQCNVCGSSAGNSNRRLGSKTLPKVNVVAPFNRDNSVFVGASTLSGLDHFSHLLSTYDDYAEMGPEVLFVDRMRDL